MVCYEGKVSLWAFWLSTCFVCLLFLPNVKYDMVPNLWGAIFWGPLLHFIFINIILKFMFKQYYYQIAIRAALLGFIFALGIYVWFLAPNSLSIFGVYMSVMAFFHYSEFVTIALANPKTLSLDTFMLNHSPQYIIAAFTSWAEFFIEAYFWPDMKTYHIIAYVGFFICLAGEILRKTAILWASSNFNHLVQNVRIDGHFLVTDGVYKFCRHPSYVGWFYWAIGTQIILLNPFCVIAYTITSWMFFYERIMIEEVTLLNFFGQQYFDYQKKVPTGLPFIEGFKIEL